MRAPRVQHRSKATQYSTLLAAVLLSATAVPWALPASATAPGEFGWSEPAALYSQSDGTFDPSVQVGIDGEGNRVAVWLQLDVTMRVYASFAPVGGAWVEPRAIDNPNPAKAILNLTLAVAENGDAVAAWLDATNFPAYGPLFDVSSAFYSHSGGWGYPQLANIETQPSTTGAHDASAPHVAIDGNGFSVIVWSQRMDHSGANETDVLSRHHAPLWVNWTAYSTLDDLAGPTSDAAVAIDDAGLAVAAWRQETAGEWSLYSSVSKGPETWAAPEIREADVATNVDKVALVSGPVGAATLLWAQGTGAGESIFTARYQGDAWGSASVLDGAQAPRGLLAVAANAGGAVIALWANDSGPNYTLSAGRYAPGAGWVVDAAVVTLEYAVPSGAPGIDAEGNALVVWQGVRDTFYPTVNVLEFLNGSGWQPSVEVDGDFAFVGSLAMAPSGAAAVAYRAFDGVALRLREVTRQTVDRQAPALEVTEEYPGTTVTGANVWISGQTEPGATVLVGDVQAYVYANGTFGISAALLPGNNRILVDAYDKAGNHGTTFVEVVFNDPAAALERELIAARAEQNATQGALDAASGRLNATSTAMSGLEASLASARSDASAAMVVGGLGIVMGVAGVALALMGRKRAAPPAATAAPVASEPPKGG
jgi:hypothetical protein